VVIDIDLLGWIVVGLFAGALSGAVVRGDRTPRGCLPNILIGIIGGVLGGFVAKALIPSTAPITTWFSAFLVALVGAVAIRWLLSLSSR
jgi:uncharacterized membrane protein YeaQ/YmgE (transglycosylase-associated protein family)